MSQRHGHVTFSATYVSFIFFMTNRHVIDICPDTTDILVNTLGIKANYEHNAMHHIPPSLATMFKARYPELEM